MNKHKEKTIKEKSIEEITAQDVGEKLSIRAQIEKIGKLKTIVVLAHFECPSCGQEISIYQDQERFQKPKKCSCGRKSGFRNYDNEMTEYKLLHLKRDNDVIDAVLKGKIALINFLEGDHVKLLSNVTNKLDKYGKGDSTSGEFFLIVEDILDHKEQTKRQVTRDFYEEKKKKGIGLIEMTNDGFFVDDKGESISIGMGHRKFLPHLARDIIEVTIYSPNGMYCG